MSKLFQYTDTRTLIRLNFGAIIVTAFCETFAIMMFLQKGLVANLPEWKYWAYLLGLVLISLLFLGSVLSMIVFLRMKQRK